MRLLRDYQTTQNEEDNYKRRLITAEENRARGEAGLLSRTDVERANNAELDAENRLLVAQQNLQNSLDGFKITLGLPTDVKLTIRPEDLAELRKQGVSENFVSQDFAMLKAIACRLDLAIAHGRAIDARRRVNIAKNAPLAGLDVIIGADFNSNDFGESRFRLDPIGMASAELTFDGAGTWVGSSFLNTTAREFAKFGYLYLRDGVWEDRRLLPEGWVDYARTPRAADDEGSVYGAHWWIWDPDVGVRVDGTPD